MTAPYNSVPPGEGMRDLEFHTELRRAARGVPEGQRHMRCDSRRLRACVWGGGAGRSEPACPAGAQAVRPGTGVGNK